MKDRYWSLLKKLLKKPVCLKNYWPDIMSCPEFLLLIILYQNSLFLLEKRYGNDNI